MTGSTVAIVNTQLRNSMVVGFCDHVRFVVNWNNSVDFYDFTTMKCVYILFRPKNEKVQGFSSTTVPVQVQP